MYELYDNLISQPYTSHTNKIVISIKNNTKHYLRYQAFIPNFKFKSNLNA